jgi:hypothetical protein
MPMICSVDSEVNGTPVGTNDNNVLRIITDLSFIVQV